MKSIQNLVEKFSRNNKANFNKFFKKPFKKTFGKN